MKSASFYFLPNPTMTRTIDDLNRAVRLHRKADETNDPEDVRRACRAFANLGVNARADAMKILYPAPVSG